MKITIEGNSEEIRNLLKAISFNGPVSNSKETDETPWWLKRSLWNGPSCGGSLTTPCYGSDYTTYAMSTGVGSVAPDLSSTTSDLSSKDDEGSRDKGSRDKGSRDKGSEDKDAYWWLKRVKDPDLEDLKSCIKERIDALEKGFENANKKDPDTEENNEESDHGLCNFYRFWKEFLKDDEKGSSDDDQEEYHEYLKKMKGDTDEGTPAKHVSVKRFPGGVAIKIDETAVVDPKGESTEETSETKDKVSDDDDPVSNFDKALKKFLKIFYSKD